MVQFERASPLPFTKNGWNRPVKVYALSSPRIWGRRTASPIDTYVPDEGGYRFYADDCFPADSPFIIPKLPLNPARIDGIIKHYQARWKNIDSGISPLGWWQRTREHTIAILEQMCFTCRRLLEQRRDTNVSSNNPKKNDDQTARNELDQQLILHIQSGQCQNAKRGPAHLGIPLDLPVREIGDLPDYVNMVVPNHIEIVEPLPEPDEEDEIKTDLLIPKECLAKPLIWRKGELHPDVANREATILKGALIAFLGDRRPDEVWIAKVLEIRTFTLDIAWYWRDPETDQYRRKPNENQRIKHNFGTWLHWGFELTQRHRLHKVSCPASKIMIASTAGDNTSGTMKSIAQRTCNCKEKRRKSAQKKRRLGTEEQEVTDEFDEDVEFFLEKIREIKRKSAKLRRKRKKRARNGSRCNW